jgi:hypothetical protein
VYNHQVSFLLYSTVLQGQFNVFSFLSWMCSLSSLAQHKCLLRVEFPMIWCRGLLRVTQSAASLFSRNMQALTNTSAPPQAHNQERLHTPTDLRQSHDQETSPHSASSPAINHTAQDQRCHNAMSEVRNLVATYRFSNCVIMTALSSHLIPLTRQDELIRRLCASRKELARVQNRERCTAESVRMLSSLPKFVVNKSRAIMCARRGSELGGEKAWRWMARKKHPCDDKRRSLSAKRTVEGSKGAMIELRSFIRVRT